MAILGNTTVTALTSLGTITAPTFSGTASQATKATQDGNGNTIASTYVKLNSGSGSQSIYSSADTPLCLRNSTTSGTAWIGFYSGSGTHNGSIGVTSGNQLQFKYGSTTATVIHSGNHASYTPNLADVTSKGSTTTSTITAGGVKLGDCTLQYDSTNKYLRFTFS